MKEKKNKKHGGITDGKKIMNVRGKKSQKNKHQ